MANLTCTICGATMRQKREPDMTVEQCDNCGAVFLDRGELNAAATALAGNIEYCSVGDVEHDDRFPNRTCPKCRDTTMNKAELLGHTGIVFDHCPKCGGFLLDKGELPAMNAELAKLSGREVPEEYRGEKDGYFVRLDRVGDVAATFWGAGLATVPRDVFYARLTVYFQRPLNAGLRVYSEKWTDRLAKAFGIGHKHDIKTGNEDLDKAAIVQADSPDAARGLVTQQPIARALTDIMSDRPKLFGNEVKVEVLDDGVVCTGGPFSERLSYDVEQDSDGIVARMVSFARAIDERR
ncbi:MAG: hypothetical protein GF331_01500 [Chitinivibrionales bacterium]|nr:hypothetical protein [Chitinivibrionales bacterium]